MNPDVKPTVLEQVHTATTLPPATGWVPSTYAVPLCSVLDWRSDWTLTPEQVAAEDAVVEALMDLTAEVGPWKAALQLFTPNPERTPS